MQTGRPSLKMVITVALIACSLFFVSDYILQQPPVPTPTASRSIVGASLPLHEVWRSRGILLRVGFGPLLLSAAEGTVFFVNHGQGWSQARLQVLDASTGQLRWQTDDDVSYEHSLAASQGRLFIAVNWNIRAFDLSNGKLLWRTPGTLPGHTGYYIYPVGDKLTVYSTMDSQSQSLDVFSAYDPATGELLEQAKSEVTEEGRLLWRTTQVDYQQDCSRRLSAVDRASGNVIWQIAVRNCVKFWPDSADSVKVFSIATGELFAADVATGEVLWRYPKKCYLNSAVMGGIVYAVREDGTLVGINEKTGSEVGTIEFSPVGKSDSAIPTYWVATDGERLFAYFGDSQELIAFQP
jgi:outer membrane protein assembly factor BamB